MSDRFESLADRLDAVSEEIAETAIDELKSALRRGDSTRPATEKTLTQARRAVDKAAHLLRTLDHDHDHEPGDAESDPFD